MSTRVKTPLAKLPVPSTSFSVEAHGRDDGSDYVIEYGYEKDGEPVDGRIRFHKARATRWRGEPYCTLWHVDEVYDTVCEVADSDFAAELRAADSASVAASFALRHYMVYLDSVGCFEVVAESVTVE